MNKLLRVYVSRQMVYRRRALAVGFENSAFGEISKLGKVQNGARVHRIRRGTRTRREAKEKNGSSAKSPRKYV